MVKILLADAGGPRDPGLIAGSGRSLGGRNGNPLQYSCLESSMDRGAWRVIVQELDTVARMSTHIALSLWYR